MTDEPWNRPGWVERAQRMLDSYRHWLGRDLIPRTGSQADQARALFDAPFVVVAHGTEPDPLLCYANRTALTLWEMDADTLVNTPSRLTAEPVHRDERARLLERTARDGYIDDYQGVRVSRTGRRFRIEGVTVWNLRGPAGEYAGQAATFAGWTDLPQAS
jgi:hypothetical protein